MAVSMAQLAREKKAYKSTGSFTSVSGSANNSNTAAPAATSMAQLAQQRQEHYKGLASSFGTDYNAFANDYNSFIKLYGRDNGWQASSYWDTASAKYKSVSDSALRLYNTIKQTPELEKSIGMSADEFYERFIKNSAQLSKSFEDSKKYYSQWLTGDAYNKYVTDKNMTAEEAQGAADAATEANKSNGSKLWDYFAMLISGFASSPEASADIVDSSRENIAKINENESTVAYYNQLANQKRVEAIPEEDLPSFGIYAAKKDNYESDSLGRIAGAASGGISMGTTTYRDVAEARQALIDKGYSEEVIDAYLQYYENKKTETFTKRAQYDIEQHPVLMGAAYTAANIATSPGRGVAALFGVDDFNNQSSAASSLITDKIHSSIVDAGGSEWLATLTTQMYQGATSGAESLLRASFGGVGEVLAGLSSATQTYSEAKKRGLSSGAAFVTGVLSGAAEVIFEHISLGNLRLFAQSGKKTVGTYVINILKQFITEGSEEVSTDLANALTDYLVNGGASEISMDIYDNIGIGYSEKQARDMALKKFGEQLTESFVVGGLAGGMSAAAATGIGAVSESAYEYGRNQALGQDIKASGTVNEILQSAYENGYKTDKEVKRNTANVLNAVKKSGSVEGIKDASLGKLAYSVTDNIANTERESAVKEYAKLLEDQGLTEKKAYSAAKAAVKESYNEELDFREKAVLKSSSVVQAREAAAANETDIAEVAEYKQTLRDRMVQYNNAPISNKAKAAEVEPANGRKVLNPSVDIENKVKAATDADERGNYGAAISKVIGESKTDLKSELIKSGVDSKKAEIAVDVMVKLAEGVEITDAEYAVITDSDVTDGLDRVLPGTARAKSASVATAAKNSVAAKNNDSSIAPAVAASENVENKTESAAAVPARTIDEVAAEYGKQAVAVKATYAQGQDVESFGRAYNYAWSIGKGYGKIEALKDNPMVSSLTAEQVKLAYKTGKSAADALAVRQGETNRAIAVSLKTGLKTIEGGDKSQTDSKHPQNTNDDVENKHEATASDAEAVDTKKTVDDAQEAVEESVQAEAAAEAAPQEEALTATKETGKQKEKRINPSKNKKTVENTAVLSDFGEKIGGARKDWRSEGIILKNLDDMNSREREANVKKDNIWKRADYKKLIEGGADRGILYAVNEIRKALNQKIDYRAAWSEEQREAKQRDFVDTIRQIQSMAEKAESKKDFEDIVKWLIDNEYVKLEKSFNGSIYPRHTNKWNENPALYGSKLLQTLSVVISDKTDLIKNADKINFAVDASSKIPRGFEIRKINVKTETGDTVEKWYITKGAYIIRDNFTSYDEALDFLKKANATQAKKTRFVPPQLLEIHRKGPDYRNSENVSGQNYLDTFKFKGGEFGNWMTAKDRQASLNYGFDALMDLAVALGIDYSDISFNGKLSIAFGSRGQGLTSAAAHYEDKRHVINLTKMNGAGSLAHEWFHALDDFIGGYTQSYASNNTQSLPERSMDAMRNLIQTMQYRESTDSETDLAATKRYEQAVRFVEYELKSKFGWIEKVRNGTFTENDAKYFKRIPTQEDVVRYDSLKSRFIAKGDAAAIEELSRLRKEIYGSVLPKENRDTLALRARLSLTPETKARVQHFNVRTEFYNNSREFGNRHSKDGDYWDSTIEMAARAFACYIADKTNKQNDYLSAHSDSTVAVIFDKNGDSKVIKAFPEGAERVAINNAFDNFIEALKADGFLHGQIEGARPDDVQYQSRTGNNRRTDSNTYGGEKRRRNAGLVPHKNGVDNTGNFEKDNRTRQVAKQNIKEQSLDFSLENSENDPQEQQRTQAYTNREVLAMAADGLVNARLNEAQRSALKMFTDKLDVMHELEGKRAEQASLYRENTDNGKKEEAAKAKARMGVLDNQIARADEELLKVENTAVLEKVLVEARKVVENTVRAQEVEKLERYRDRRNNSEAVKKYRKRIEQNVNELYKWMLHPGNKDITKHVPEILKDSIIPFLESIDMSSKRQLAGGKQSQKDVKFTELLDNVREAFKRNQSIMDEYAGYSDLPENFMDTLEDIIKVSKTLAKDSSGDYVVNLMTASELKELSDIVSNIKAFIKNTNMFLHNSMFQHVDEAAQTSIDYMRSMKPMSHTGAMSNFVLVTQMRPAYVMERFGKGGIAIYDGLRRGQGKLAFNTKEIIDFSNKTYTEKEIKEWESTYHEFELDGDTVRIPVSHIMSFYELLKRKQAKTHIFGNGIRVATFKNGKKISDSGHRITVDEAQRIVESLSDRQREVADSLQKYMARHGGEWGNYVSLARFGVKAFTEDDYFPINTDGRQLANVSADSKPGNSSLYALLNMSFTKELTENASNGIVLYSIFDVFANHMSDMAQYNALALPVLDAMKWFNYRETEKQPSKEDNKKLVIIEKASVRQEMIRAYGAPEESSNGTSRGYAETFFVNILKAFNGTEAQGSSYDSVGLKFLHKYNIAQIAFNARVVVQQPLSVMRAGLIIDYRDILSALKQSPKTIKSNIAEMEKYSGIAAWKGLGFYDVNVSRGVSTLIRHDETVTDKVTEIGMAGAELADKVTWASIWMACKHHVLKSHKAHDAEFYKLTSDLFEEVIYKTQVVDSVLTKNEFMRDKGFWARSVGAFMSEPTTTASMVIDAVDKYNADRRSGMSRQEAWKKHGRNFARTAYVYALSGILLSVVQSVADAWRDDDDYETFPEKIIEAFSGNIIDELSPVNLLPYGNVAWEIGKEIAGAFGADTYGNVSDSPISRIADTSRKAVEIAVDKYTGEKTNYTRYAVIYKLLQTAAGITGLPFATATREVVTAWNNIVGTIAPSLNIEIPFDKITDYDAGEMTKIKYAFTDGYLTDTQAIKELLDKQLVDDENEAWFKVDEWSADGDGYSKYGDLLEAVKNKDSSGVTEAMNVLKEHGISEKQAKSQIKSSIGEWYRSGDISESEAADMLRGRIGMDTDDIDTLITKWDCEVETGVSFGEIQDKYIAGDMLKSEVKEALVKYGDMTAEDAENRIKYWDFKQQYPQYEWSEARVLTYYSTMQPAGISMAHFDSYLDKAALCKGEDSNEDGKTDSGTVKAQVLLVIDALPLTNAQKDVLYYFNNWSEKTINEAPWH